MNENEMSRSSGPVVPEEASKLPESGLHRILRENCGYFLALAGTLGAVFALCFVEVGSWGISFLLWAAAWAVCGHLALRRLGLNNLRRDGLWYAGTVLLAVSVFWTANPFIQFVSSVGMALLQCFWALNAFTDIRDWRFGEAAGAVLRLGFRSLGRVGEPFRHMAEARCGGQKMAESGKTSGRSWLYILWGLVIAVPLAGAALLLLTSADAVFRTVLESIFDMDADWRLLRRGVKCLFAFSLTALGFYAVLCAQTASPEPRDQREGKRTNALVAVTFTAVLSVIYMMFCFIQVSVLFAGRETWLPEGYTYAQYAREGFFQLLAVSAMNVLLVIVSQQKFSPSRTLQALLLVISGCTYLMEVSSAWRMILYVQAYGLTFLRLLVLWFLLVLAVVLLGAVVTVFRPGFRLFRFTLTVCLVFWLVFAFARPDALAARYDLRRFGPREDILVLISNELFADGVEELAPYLENVETVPEPLERYLTRRIPEEYGAAGVRGFNYSLWRANRVSEEYRYER